MPKTGQASPQFSLHLDARKQDLVYEKNAGRPCWFWPPIT